MQRDPTRTPAKLRALNLFKASERNIRREGPCMIVSGHCYFGEAEVRVNGDILEVLIPSVNPYVITGEGPTTEPEWVFVSPNAGRTFSAPYDAVWTLRRLIRFMRA